jgi:two-component system, sensor histidine kinase and response regulator
MTTAPQSSLQQDLPQRLAEEITRREVAEARVCALEFALNRATHPASPADPQGFTGELVLVVDDQDMNRQLAQAVLSDCDLNLVCLSSAEAAIGFVQQQIPAVILMDVQMPLMDGYTAARCIRELPSGHRPVILAMTANNRPEDEKASLAAGMQGHICKPIDAEQLIKHLQKALKAPATETAPCAQAQPPAPEITPLTDGPLSELPGIDLAAAMARLRGNRNLFNEVFLSFAEKAQTLVPQLEDFAARADYTEATRCLHRLKGTAANLSATRLYPLAARLETLTKAGQMPSTDDINALQSAIDEIVAAAGLITAHQEKQPKAASDTQNSQIAEILQSLQKHLYSDLGEAQDWVEKLFDESRNTSMAALANQLRADFYQFNIRAVKQQIDSWMLQQGIHND